MSLTVLAWLAVAAYALHIVEEHILGWQGWAQRSMSLSIDADSYVIVEVAFLVLGAIAAMLVPVAPVYALAFGAFLLINVTFFHLLPMLMSGGKFSPGIITGILLFYPIGYYEFMGTKLPQESLIVAALIGAGIILWPVLLLKLRGQRYFQGGPARRRR